MTEATNTNDQWTEQTLRASVSTGYSLRNLAMVVVCLIFGIWGIYDYVWSIPAHERAFARGEVCRDVRSCIDTVSTGSKSPLVEETVTVIDIQLAEEIPGNVSAEDLSWRHSLELFRDAIDPPSTISPTDLPALQEEAIREADAGLELYGDVDEPSKFDRPVQWAFILCLPFVPYFAWMLFSTGSRRYQFDTDGTFQMPEGTWTGNEIAEIDMRRWMAKSICWVQNVDGGRVKLDAHVYKGLDTIIGVIAHRLMPDQWGLDARPVSKTSGETPDPAAVEDSSGEA